MSIVKPACDTRRATSSGSIRASAASTACISNERSSQWWAVVRKQNWKLLIGQTAVVGWRRETSSVARRGRRMCRPRPRRARRRGLRRAIRKDAGRRRGPSERRHADLGVRHVPELDDGRHVPELDDGLRARQRRWGRPRGRRGGRVAIGPRGPSTDHGRGVRQDGRSDRHGADLRAPPPAAPSPGRDGAPFPHLPLPLTEERCDVPWKRRVRRRALPVHRGPRPARPRTRSAARPARRHTGDGGLLR
jgi:hypothetical protein